MFIDINIPYGDNRRLGESMNRTMSRLNDEDWIIFMDSDFLIMTLHQLWYSACKKVIDEIGYKAGFISCLTNRIGCKWQKIGSPDTDNIKEHFEFAKKLWDTNGTNYEILPCGACLSGMFIMTHKKAWLDAGGFNAGWDVDNNYDIAITKMGYKRIIMKGVYGYHIYKKKSEWWNGEIK